jgi:hypothetical protein
MPITASTHSIAFEGVRQIAAGALADVAAKAKAALGRGGDGPIFIFDAVTSEPIDLDLRGTLSDAFKWLPATGAASEPARGPGRPKLGVVAREVTLLPRHWDWLSSQPGGASVALRRLVEDARQINADKDQQRAAQEATYRFMSAMSGDRENFEEAARALFARDASRFERLIAKWPKDIRKHTLELASKCLPVQGGTEHAGVI